MKESAMKNRAGRIPGESGQGAPRENHSQTPNNTGPYLVEGRPHQEERPDEKGRKEQGLMNGSRKGRFK